MLGRFLLHFSDSEKRNTQLEEHPNSGLECLIAGPDSVDNFTLEWQYYCQLAA